MFGFENQTVQFSFLEAKAIYNCVKFISLSSISHHFYLPDFKLKSIQNTCPKNLWPIKIPVPTSTKTLLFQITQLVEIQVLAPTSIMTIGWIKIKSVFRTLQSNLFFISDDNDNDVELIGKAKIKANRRFFNSIAAANKYVKTFTFKKDCPHIQIDIIENCKKKISIRSTTYTRLITKFLFDWS